ncbi:hypothetical protein [Halorussus aquaticus]|uniref:Uncharacterized protein n=1 Tax=Halorussus aquaticus TaxID=2953748 RepID=A0ABD5Q3T4_9EURY|nr:hypothetical protein [Halorussus aquaticus]
MSSFDFDGIDIPLLAAFALFGVVATGIGSISLFGIDFNQTLFTALGFDASYAFVGSIVSLAGIGATNEIDSTDLELEQRALLGAALFVMVIQQWVPEVNNAITGNDFVGLAVFLLEAGAAASISYLG